MTVSLLGDGIYLVAVAWQVYDLSNDPAALSLVGLAWTSGMVAFLLFGVGLPDENAHAPNEKLDLGNFHGGIISAAYLYQEIAQLKG